MSKRNSNRRPQNSKAPKSGNTKFTERGETNRKSEPYKRNAKHTKGWN